eukprot:gene29596-35728_t
MTTITLPPITSFKGTKTDLYLNFIPAVMSGARTASSNPYQILWDIMTEDQRAVEPVFQQGFQAAVVPPPQPPQDGPAFNAWKHADEKHEKLQAQRANFAAWVKSGIPSAVLKKLTQNGVHGNAMTVTQILTRLRQVYGKLTHKDLEDANTRMSVFITLGQEVEEFIRIHEEAHSLYDEAGTPMTERNKIQTMTNALKGCDAYEQFTADFYKDHRDLATQTFEALCQELREYQVPTRFNKATSLLSAAGTASAPVARNPGEWNTSNNKRKRNDDDDEEEPRDLYCHTCGLGNHAGVNCTNKASGHQDKATIDNRMGGSTKFVPGACLKGEPFDPSRRRKKRN